MNFSIMIHESAEVFAQRDDPAQRAILFAPIGAYLQALRDAGVFVGGAGLEPPRTASVLSPSGDGWQVQDGPFADTKEQLAGLIIVDVPDRARALEWARRFPATAGRRLELRANLVPPQE
ncbi:MAG TPA: YciI family protein [Rhodanobacteraceae bacterium]|nr:YciI family protein [Rhodanobacteraceae bacterium]